MLRSLIIPMLSLSATGLSAQTLLKGEDHCRPSFNPNSLWMCQDSKSTVMADQLTATENSFVRSLKIDSVLTYQMSCFANPAPTESFVLVNGTSLDLLIGDLGIKTIDRSLSYDQLVGTQYEFNFVFPITTSVLKNQCNVTLLSNVSTINLDPLRSYVALISETIDDSVDYLEQVSKVEVEPAGSSILEDFAEEIPDRISDLELDIEDLELEVADDPSAKLKILDKKEQIDWLNKLSEAIASANSGTDTCEGAEDESANCNVVLAQLSKDIKAKIEADKSKLVELKSFLDGEYERLKAKEATYAARIERLIRRLNRLFPEE
ncbi:MAG: hypothetical protein HRU19_11275 [Pseudobacteriovorax sp.]|nr:hypothetical protein [Pseudobacteriovorax sp.]